jgi:hypothetical protein
MIGTVLQLFSVGLALAKISLAEHELELISLSVFIWWS